MITMQSDLVEAVVVLDGLEGLILQGHIGVLLGKLEERICFHAGSKLATALSSTYQAAASLVRDEVVIGLQAIGDFQAGHEDVLCLGHSSGLQPHVHGARSQA